ncbi:HtaA domain-containing protein [Leucobacter sp. USCH14]|uniref:HtaA domain-containing protein n=1 Tax=Leucobacter sp. USCH14 TaxID=3024838 RepID=UPI0030AD42A5
MNPLTLSRTRSAVIAFVSAIAVAGSLILNVAPAFASDSDAQSAVSSHVGGGRSVTGVELHVQASHSGDRYELTVAGSILPPENTTTSGIERVEAAVIPRGQEAHPSAVADGVIATVPVDESGNFTADNGELSIASASLEDGEAFDVVVWPAHEELDPRSVLRRVEVQMDPAPEGSVPEAEAMEGSEEIGLEAEAAHSAQSGDHAESFLELQQRTLTVEVEEKANDGLIVSISGSGFDDVKKLPGQDSPHVYGMLSKVGADLSQVSASDTAISMEVRDGAITGTLEVPIEELEPYEDYEVITWPSRSNPTPSSIYARATADIDWNVVLPEGEEGAPSLQAAVLTASEKGLTVTVTGEQFAPDVAGGSVTVALALESENAYNSVVSNTVELKSDGRLDTKISASRSKLDRGATYRVIAYGKSEANELASAPVRVTADHWTRIFGAPTPGTVSVEQVRVVPEGLETRVRASNLPSDLVYVAIIEKGTEASLTQEGGYVDFLYQPEVRNGEGSFTFVTPKEGFKRSKEYEVLVWRSHSNPTKDNLYGRDDLVVTAAQWDALQGTKAPQKPAAASPKPAPVSSESTAAAGSLTWGISSEFADYTTNPKRAGGKSGGKILTDGVGSAGGAYMFPQADGGSWNSATQTGSIQYSGVVTFTAHKGLMNEVFSNPTISVSSPSAATLTVSGRKYGLDLSAASKATGSNGEVTWSGVPVAGSISGGNGSGGGSLGMDALSFTVGAASKVSFGTTVASSPEKKQYTAADTPPATTGVTVLTDADKIKPGGRIEIEASGFDADDEGVLVVLYSDPIVLDDAATADENGVVRWSGTLPEDVSGEHTITIQGSTNAGAVIDIVEPKQKKSAKSAGVDTETLAGGVAVDRMTSAGLVPASGGMALWEWWASAAGLVAIAACMTLLTIRQRRNAA